MRDSQKKKSINLLKSGNSQKPFSSITLKKDDLVCQGANLEIAVLRTICYSFEMTTNFTSPSHRVHHVYFTIRQKSLLSKTVASLCQRAARGE